MEDLGDVAAVLKNGDAKLVVFESGGRASEERSAEHGSTIMHEPGSASACRSHGQSAIGFDVPAIALFDHPVSDGNVLQKFPVEIGFNEAASFHSRKLTKAICSPLRDGRPMSAHRRSQCLYAHRMRRLLL